MAVPSNRSWMRQRNKKGRNIMRYLSVIIVALLFLSTSSTLDAQVRASVTFNVGSQPIWGPTGYDYVENYYLPDMDVYYNVPQHRYYYNNNGRWIGSANLPSRYRSHDIYNSYKVVVNEREPWRNHATYKEKYSSFRDRHDQQPIRDSRDSKYFVIANHPQHTTWVQQQKHDNGNHYGQNKGNKGNGKNKNKQNR
jgi:hypothetical protein